MIDTQVQKYLDTLAALKKLYQEAEQQWQVLPVPSKSILFTPEEMFRRFTKDTKLQ